MTQGYAALLGAFGPSLLDATGSRPAARQADGMVGAARIRHPRELRAIPNNAILQQLGWCANTLQGIGAARGAASRDCSSICGRTAGASTARWTWRRTRWRIPTSTCCAR